jgi:hypothetical protein
MSKADRQYDPITNPNGIRGIQPTPYYDEFAIWPTSELLRAAFTPAGFTVDLSACPGSSVFYEQFIDCLAPAKQAAPAPPFYMLYSPDGNIPTYKHGTWLDAKKEADRLINTGRARQVFILCPTDKVEKPPSTITTKIANVRTLKP